MTHPFGTVTLFGAARVRRILACTALIGSALAGGAILTGSTALSHIDSIAAAIAPTTATTHAADGTCAGVTVVVDFTDLGGKVDVACAEGEQPTGRDALIAAGFTATDSQPGLLCAINSMPNPCPETFQGSFWSYWHSSGNGEWTSYQVGADSSHPVAGELEGWRYNNGTTPPGIAPADAASAVTVPSPSPVPSDSNPQSAATQTDITTQRTNQNTVLLVATVGFLAVVAAVVIVLFLRRRRASESPSAPEADDTGARD
ncbi:MAG TPA: hypothetical protein PJ998_02370 [Terrimesophilobacter sp.]|nr:hypothetical protein [Terrimesophilobacter sp.]